MFGEANIFLYPQFQVRLHNCTRGKFVGSLKDRSTEDRISPKKVYDDEPPLTSFKFNKNQYFEGSAHVDDFLSFSMTTISAIGAIHVSHATPSKTSKPELHVRFSCEDPSFSLIASIT